MNKNRRSILTRIASVLADIEQDIVSIQDEEQEAFDNLPESFQDSERGESMQAAIDSLEEATGLIAEASSAIESAIE